MSFTCIHCGKDNPDPSQGTTAEELRAICLREGWFVWPDGTVDKEFAAMLLAVSVRTLDNWRVADKGPPYRKNSQTARVRYALAGLAAFISKADHG